MRNRIIVGVVVLTALIGAGTLAARTASDVRSDKQWTIANFVDPLLVKDTIVMGSVLIVHDSEKMARGEACTTFYRFKPGAGPKEELVTFHCEPRPGTKVETTTFKTMSSEPGCKRLIEYQIAGDAEAHGIPIQ